MDERPEGTVSDADELLGTVSRDIRNDAGRLYRTRARGVANLRTLGLSDAEIERLMGAPMPEHVRTDR